MTGYTKLWSEILDSTVWETSKHVRLVWITMLAMADKDGVVSASIPGLARRAIVTLEECEEALQAFQSPDRYSRTKANEGRRIEEVDGGWHLLNHRAYRDRLSKEHKREQGRKRTAKCREKQGGNSPVTPVTNCDASNDTQKQKQKQEEKQEEKHPSGAPALPGPSKGKGTRLPKAWILPKAWGDWAMSTEGLSRTETQRTADKFHDHWLSVSGRSAVKVDWKAVWRNWVRRENDFAARNNPRSSNADTRPEDRVQLQDPSGLTVEEFMARKLAAKPDPAKDQPGLEAFKAKMAAAKAAAETEKETSDDGQGIRET